VSWLARRAEEGKPGVTCPPKKDPGALNVEYKREYLSEYAHLGDETNSSIAVRLREGMDKIFFEETKTRLLDRLEKALGPEGARRYGVVDDGRRPKQFRIAVPRGNIRRLDWTISAGTSKLAKTSSRTQ